MFVDKSLVNYANHLTSVPTESKLTYRSRKNQIRQQKIKKSTNHPSQSFRVSFSGLGARLSGPGTTGTFVNMKWVAISLAFIILLMEPTRQRLTHNATHACCASLSLSINISISFSNMTARWHNCTTRTGRNDGTHCKGLANSLSGGKSFSYCKIYGYLFSWHRCRLFLGGICSQGTLHGLLYGWGEAGQAGQSDAFSFLFSGTGKRQYYRLFNQILSISSTIFLWLFEVL